MREKEDIISEFKRNESLDYLKALKSLNEIPFPVGKNLLIDFLKGDEKNLSIRKNKLNFLNNFSSMKNKDKQEIKLIIENLIQNSLIEVSSGFNQFSKILSITSKGTQELINPTLNEKKLKNHLTFQINDITKEERVLFKELDFFLKEFNDFQKKAIISVKEKILCIAGAGSGKTTVLTKKIEFLVKYKSVNPEKILAITFTRKAREEMEKRLAKIGISTNIETFNSFSEKMLLKNSSRIYTQKKRMMNYSDKILAIISALENIGMNINEATEKYFTENQNKHKNPEELSNIFMNDCFSILEYFKSKNKRLYDFTEEADEKNLENAKIIYNVCKYLEQYMEIQGLRDYTDQVLDCINFFKSNKEFVPEFDYVLIDEYQDINEMQIELINLITKKNLFCVGDPRQSIFGWRGGNIGYIMKFHEKYPDAEIISLNKNYRSKKRIINLMNLAIKDLGLDNLNNFHEEDGEINLKEFDSEEDEHRFVIEKILNSNIEKEEIFVLARTNRQIKDLSEKMKARKIIHIVKTDELKNPVSAKTGEVTLSTIHAIKGLEAKLVFVIGCNESNFPCKASDHPVIEIVKPNDYDKEEEEKRLFYVAISRAKEKLFLSYSGKKPTYFISDEMIKIIEGGLF